MLLVLLLRKFQKIKLLFQEGLNGTEWISMREQEGANTVKQFTGRDVPVVVDPTMLLTPDEWRKVSRKPAWYVAKIISPTLYF